MGRYLTPHTVLRPATKVDHEQYTTLQSFILILVNTHLFIIFVYMLCSKQ